MWRLGFCSRFLAFGSRRLSFVAGELPQYPSVSKGGGREGVDVTMCANQKSLTNICNQKPSKFRPLWLHPCVLHAFFCSTKLVLLCISVHGHPQLLQNHPTVAQQCLKADKTARSTCFEFLSACDPSLTHLLTHCCLSWHPGWSCLLQALCLSHRSPKPLKLVFRWIFFPASSSKKLDSWGKMQSFSIEKRVDLSILIDRR